MIRAFGAGLTLAAVLTAAPAFAQDEAAQSRSSTRITPYIQLDQVVTADLNRGNDVLTYTEIAAGVDVSAHSRRVEVGFSYQYEHRFGENRYTPDENIHSALARVAWKVAPGLQIDGGALATRSRSDIRGVDPGFYTGSNANVSKIYSGYVGPSYATQLGEISASAAYRIGATKVTTPGYYALQNGQPRLDLYDRDVVQVATASLGSRAGGLLPVAVTLNGAWSRDDATQLDQRYDDKFVRGDVALPIARNLAVEGGVGYEKVTVSQRDPLLNANGTAVTDSNGRYVTDKASPRRIAYDFDGIFWDAGVVWKPSPRTQAEFHVGHRYGSMSYTGMVGYAPNRHLTMRIVGYDAVTTFGQQLQTGLSGLPTSFVTARDTLFQQYNGCVYGARGQAGGCLNGALQSVSTSTYRARGVDGVISLQEGRWSFGVGAGYSNRLYYVPELSAFNLNGLTDQSIYGQGFAGYQLDRHSSLSGAVFVNEWDSGIAGAASVTGVGATGTYAYNLGHFGATLTGGVYEYDQSNGGPSDVTASGLLGMRYVF